MDKYRVRLYTEALKDIDNIYLYIAYNLKEPSTANQIVTALESAILSLKTMPGRGAPRHTGVYGNKGYRQLFVGNYTIIYKIVREDLEVHILTVRYSSSDF